MPIRAASADLKGWYWMKWVALLALVGLASFVAMAWWFVWSVVTLANGNPATAWNICGLIFGGSATLGMIWKGLNA